METAKEHNRNVYMCFIDYKKSFDCVDHEKLWVILEDMGVPVHLIVLLKKLYTKHKATTRMYFIPLLFNIYAENIMKEALEDWDGGISIGGRRITNLRYADDTALIAETKNDLIAIMERVKLASEKADKCRHN